MFYQVWNEGIESLCSSINSFAGMVMIGSIIVAVATIIFFSHLK